MTLVTLKPATKLEKVVVLKIAPQLFLKQTLKFENKITEMY